jgi:predicted PhzF superfamily epimerase YddE/YHI9
MHLLPLMLYQETRYKERDVTSSLFAPAPGIMSDISSTNAAAELEQALQQYGMYEPIVRRLEGENLQKRLRTNVV